MAYLSQPSGMEHSPPSSPFPGPEEVNGKLIAFVEQISRAPNLKSWLALLKSHIPKKLKPGELILFYESKQFGLRRAYIRNNKFYEETAQQPWDSPQTISPCSLETSLYLAREMGRPFSQVLTMPFYETEYFRHRGKLAPVLFIELSNIQKTGAVTADFFRNRAEILQITLNRALHNTNTVRASHLWNQVFENWTEALAIVEGRRVIRSNRCFKKLISGQTGLLKLMKTKEIIQLRGRSYRFHYRPILPAGGGAGERGLIYCRDLTEYFRLKENLLQSEKMTAIGKLGQNMAHALNNPLTGLQAMAQILSQNPALEKFREDFQTLSLATERSQKIIEGLLTFSRSKKAEKRVCCVNTVIRETLPLLKTLSQNIEIKLCLNETDSPVVYENPSLLRQMVFNLMTNACHALENRPNPRIEVISKTSDRGQLVLKIRDNGCGIPEDLTEKIFQPLWTTKKPGEGTGLGLGIVRKFVRRAGGDIQVSGQLNEGSMFTVRLPLWKAERENANEEKRDVL